MRSGGWLSCACIRKAGAANITQQTTHSAIVRDIFMKSASWRLRLCALASNLISGLHFKRRSFWRPAPLPRGRADSGREISSPTSWSHFWLWGLSSSWDRRIFPEKSVPSVRYRSKCGKCSPAGSREPYAAGPFWGLRRMGPDGGTLARAGLCWPAEPESFEDFQVALVTFFL